MTRCPFEDRVLASFGGDKLSDDLANHLDACVSCQEDVQIRNLMRIEAVTLGTHASIPPAALVLCRAKLRRTKRNADSACRPVSLAQGFSLLAICAYVLLTREDIRFSGVGEALGLAALALVTTGVLTAWSTAMADWQRTVLQHGATRDRGRLRLHRNHD